MEFDFHNKTPNRQSVSVQFLKNTVNSLYFTKQHTTERRQPHVEILPFHSLWDDPFGTKAEWYDNQSGRTVWMCSCCHISAECLWPTQYLQRQANSHNTTSNRHNRVKALNRKLIILEMTTVINLGRVWRLAVGQTTDRTIFTLLPMTSPGEFDHMHVCCISLIFSGLCDHLVFVWCSPFKGRTMRERGH